MKNKSFSSNLATFLLMNLLFALKHLNAQSGEADSTNNNVFKDWNDKVMGISDRIAKAYNADYYTVESFVWAAREYEDQTGIPATVIIGIAVYESSFTSDLFLHSGNPFGIKAGRDWTGPTFSKFADGEDTQFRMYISPEEAVLDFGAFVQARGWYKDALSCSRTDYKCVVNGLKKTDTEPGYSTNPVWDTRLIEIIEKLELQELSK